MARLSPGVLDDKEGDRKSMTAFQHRTSEHLCLKWIDGRKANFGVNLKKQKETILI